MREGPVDRCHALDEALTVRVSAVALWLKGREEGRWGCQGGQDCGHTSQGCGPMPLFRPNLGAQDSGQTVKMGFLEAE